MLWPTLLSGLYCPNQKQSQALSDVQSRPSRHLPEQRETERDQTITSALPSLLPPYRQLFSGRGPDSSATDQVLLKEVTSSALCLTGEIYNTSDRAGAVKEK